jgi:hypothetical protein
MVLLLLICRPEWVAASGQGEVAGILGLLVGWFFADREAWQPPVF